MYFHCRSNPRRFLAATLLFGLTHTSATTAAKITIDTDLLRIDGESNGTLFGTPFTAQLDSRGVAQFLFHGDLDLERDKIRFIGNRPASFIVGGNANIEGATFDVSAVNQLGGIGGGSGGGVGISGTGGIGGENVFDPPANVRSSGGTGGAGGLGGARGGWPSGIGENAAFGGDTGVRLGIRDSNLHPFRSRLPSSQHPPTPNAIPNPPSDPCEARMAMPRKVSAAVTHMEYIRRQSPPSDGLARECTNRHVCLRRRPLSWPRTLPLAEFNVKPVSSNPAPSYGCHN